MTAEINTKLQTVTARAERVAFKITKGKLAEKLNITRPTLERKFKSNDWTYTEKLIIDDLCKLLIENVLNDNQKND